MFGNKNRTVAVNSSPQGAKVFLNGNLVGRTPSSITVANPSGNVITLQKSGYYTGESSIPTHFQGVGFLNIFFWPGFIVDAATGDMHAVDSNVSVALRKK